MAACAAVTAQVFKWVDERGVTHYGERPPQGAKASEVQNKLASPAPSGGAAESAPPKEQRQEPQPASKGPPAKPKPPPTREELEAAKRQTQCDQQRAILERLKSSPPSYTLNEKGDKVPFDNSEIISQQEQRVAQQCPRG